MRKPSVSVAFIVGVVFGLSIYQIILFFSANEVISRAELNRQQNALAALEAENYELTDELFRFRTPGEVFLGDLELPYDGNADASEEVKSARVQARQEGKFLMVTFGANWCQDCRTLYKNLHSKAVRAYAADMFEFVNVDVGKFNRNRHVAEALGVNLNRGIPVAIFFDPEGAEIGATNEGQLEPARYYSSKQILKFMRDVAERSLIAPPDSID